MAKPGTTGLTTPTPHSATIRYAAPEVLLYEEEIPAFVPTPFSDVYSLGSTIYTVRIHYHMNFHL